MIESQPNITPIEVWRQDAKFNTHRLTPSELRRDEVAASAQHWGEAFLSWSAQYGWAPRKSPQKLYLSAMPMYTDNANAVITLGRPVLMHKHLARSPEVIGHEFGHGVADSIYDFATDMSDVAVLGDGIADLVGVAFARSSGHGPALADWRLGDELARPGTRVRMPYFRDLARPKFPTVDTLVEHQRSAGFGVPPSHAAGGPLALAYVRMVEALGDRAATDIAMRGLLTELPRVLGPAPDRDMDRWIKAITREHFDEGALRGAFVRMGQALLNAADAAQRPAVADALRATGMLT